MRDESAASTMATPAIIVRTTAPGFSRTAAGAVLGTNLPYYSLAVWHGITAPAGMDPALVGTPQVVVAKKG